MLNGSTTTLIFVIMVVKLKGELDFELQKLGLKEGDIIDVVPQVGSKVGAMNFTRYYNGFRMECVVWPVNYDIVTP